MAGRADQLLGTKLARKRPTLVQLFEALREKGYAGGYDAVQRYARGWQRASAATSAPAFMPLSFAPGEAYQFNWSHECCFALKVDPRFSSKSDPADGTSRDAGVGSSG